MYARTDGEEEEEEEEEGNGDGSCGGEEEERAKGRILLADIALRQTLTPPPLMHPSPTPSTPGQSGNYIAHLGEREKLKVEIRAFLRLCSPQMKKNPSLFVPLILSSEESSKMYSRSNNV